MYRKSTRAPTSAVLLAILPILKLIGDDMRELLDHAVDEYKTTVL